MTVAHLSLPLNCNAVPRAINGMLRSMYDGVLRVFGNRHKNKEASFNNLYIQSRKPNGENSSPHSAFAKGGTLEIAWGDKSDKSRGMKGQKIKLRLWSA